MSASEQVFVGVTTWNSEVLLPLCLDSLRRTAPDATIHVLDNASTDGTLAKARQFGVPVTIRRCGQADALNHLASMSSRPYTVLVHSDVVFTSTRWVETVLSAFVGTVALVSPEDIGCGPYTRPWGKDKPESSFMCFDTNKLKHLRIRRWARRFRVPYFRRMVDFYGDHITYNLPLRLSAAGLTWVPMNVLVSERLAKPYYVPDFELRHWRPEFARLRYGLGNFYSLNGIVTHYHNWYDRRVDKTKDFNPRETLEINGGGVPVAFLKAYTENFITDYVNGSLSLPEAVAASSDSG